MSEIRIVKVDDRTFWLVLESDSGSTHTELTPKQLAELRGAK